MFNWIKSTAKTISACIKGKDYTIAADHPNFAAIEAAADAGDADKFVKLTDIPAALNEYTLGLVKISGGQVYYDDKVINNTLTTRILDMMSKQLPFSPMVLFLSNVMLNPSERARNELYAWLEHQDIPITTDGHWLGYKRVGPDFLDIHSSTVLNKIGEQPTMDRDAVDPNWGVACSQGFHIGSMGYVGTFCAGGKNHLMIVKVHPKDVVTVPSSETSKCRVSTYLVIAEYTETLTWPVYEAFGVGQPIRAVSNIVLDSKSTGPSTDDPDGVLAKSSPINSSVGENDLAYDYQDMIVEVTLKGKTSDGVEEELGDHAGGDHTDIRDDGDLDVLIYEFTSRAAAELFRDDILDLSYVANYIIKESDSDSEEDADDDSEDEEETNVDDLLHLHPQIRFELRQRAIEYLAAQSPLTPRHVIEVKVESMTRREMANVLPEVESKKYLNTDLKTKIEDIYPISFDLYDGDLKVSRHNVRTVEEESAIMTMAAQIYLNLSQKNRLDKSKL